MLNLWITQLLIHNAVDNDLINREKMWKSCPKMWKKEGFLVDKQAKTVENVDSLWMNRG